MHYLNHAGTSWPKPAPVHAAVHEALSASPARYADLHQHAQETIESEFSDGGQLLLTSGCTAALALCLGDLPWQHGQRLLTSSLEHHALDRQAQALELARGVERVMLPYVRADVFSSDDLDTELGKGRVGAVAVTAASNVTGEQPSLQEVAEVTSRHGVRLVVDAAQTFGTDAFEQTRDHADVIVAAGHKSALGPQGIGVLWAKDSVEFSSPGAACEIGEIACASRPGFCDVGSVNLAGACGLAAGLRWTRQQRAALGEAARGFAQQVRHAIGELETLHVLGPQAADGEAALPIVSFASRTHEPQALAARLHAAGAWVRAGTHCAPRALEALGAPDGCVRASFGPMSTQADAEALIRALRQLGA